MPRLKVACFELLVAIVQTQGAELMVLQTIDWGRLSVSVLLAECKAVGCIHQQDKEVASLLGARGLVRAGALRARHDIWDAVYVNTSRDDGRRLPWGTGAISDPKPDPRPASIRTRSVTPHGPRNPRHLHRGARVHDG